MTSKIQLYPPKPIKDYWDCSECDSKRSVSAFNMWYIGTQYQSAGTCKKCGTIWLSVRKYD